MFSPCSCSAMASVFWKSNASSSLPHGCTSITLRASGALSATSWNAKTRPSNSRWPTYRWRSSKRTVPWRTAQQTCCQTGRKPNQWPYVKWHERHPLISAAVESCLGVLTQFSAVCRCRAVCVRRRRCSLSPSTRANLAVWRTIERNAQRPKKRWNWQTQVFWAAARREYRWPVIRQTCSVLTMSLKGKKCDKQMLCYSC